MTTAQQGETAILAMGVPRFLILGSNLADPARDVSAPCRESCRHRHRAESPTRRGAQQLPGSRDLPGRVVQMDLWRPPPRACGSRDASDRPRVCVTGELCNALHAAATPPRALGRRLQHPPLFEVPHPLIPPIAELRDLVENGPVSGALLLTTMQTGGVGYNNLERLPSWRACLPSYSWPAAAEALVQPIHTDDVVHCIRRCLDQMPGSPVVALGAGTVALRGSDSPRGAAVGKRFGRRPYRTALCTSRRPYSQPPGGPASRQKNSGEWPKTRCATPQRWSGSGSSHVPFSTKSHLGLSRRHQPRVRLTRIVRRALAPTGLSAEFR